MGKKIFLVFTLSTIFALTAMTPPVTAEEKTKTEPSKTLTSKTAPTNVNNITQAAVKAGVLSCASRINQVTNFITASSQDYGALMFRAPNNPDKQIFSVSMEIPFRDASAYASAGFAPNQANGCGGIYETVVYWPQKCSEAAEKNFGTFKKTGALSKNITVLNGGESTKVFLMPAGAGCVSIKKELVQ